MNDLERLRGLGYEYFHIQGGRNVPPYTSPSLTLAYKGNLPPKLEGESEIITTIAKDLATYIADRIVPVTNPYQYQGYIPVYEDGEFRCGVDLIKRRGDDSRLNVASIATRNQGREIVIALASSSLPLFPSGIPGYPPSKQMLGLLEDYSRIFRVRGHSLLIP